VIDVVVPSTLALLSCCAAVRGEHRERGPEVELDEEALVVDEVVDEVLEEREEVARVVGVALGPTVERTRAPTSATPSKAKMTPRPRGLRPPVMPVSAGSMKTGKNSL